MAADPVRISGFRRHPSPIGSAEIVPPEPVSHRRPPPFSTASLSLDLAIGIGGVPRGRIIEIYGPESSGKTTLALSIAAQAQKEGGVVAFIDAEHALDPTWAERLGVSLNDLLVSQPNYGE